MAEKVHLGVHAQYRNVYIESGPSSIREQIKNHTEYSIFPTENDQ